MARRPPALVQSNYLQALGMGNDSASLCFVAAMAIVIGARTLTSSNDLKKKGIDFRCLLIRWEKCYHDWDSGGSGGKRSKH